MESIETVYEERRQRFARLAGSRSRRSAGLANARLAVFVLGVAAFLAPVLVGSSVSLHATMAVCAVLFAVLVVLHGRVDRQRRRAVERRRLNEEAIARLARDWDRVPEPRLALERPPSFARDLDLFGHASLWKLLGRVSTPLGKATLARWLLEPAAPAVARARQQAVRELAPRLDFRQELERRARDLEKSDPDCEPFLRWAEGEPWLAGRPILVWCARILPPITLALLGLALAGLVPHHLWLLLGLFNVALSAAVGKEIGAIFGRISRGEGEFLAYARVLELLAERQVREQSPELLRRLAQQWTTGPPEGDKRSTSAHRQMARLYRLVVLAEVRYSGATHLPLQALLLWDFHVLGRLEKWQRQAGRSARAWLTALGDSEALCALAGLAFDEPQWTFPELIEPGGPDDVQLCARGLGHPLLGARRVANDVTLGPPGTFLLITGSNMSGKSTLIRSLGLNVVLAQAGGPVCARSLRLPPLELGTSVLIEDSLEDGVSFFMAELKRVKEIVDRASASRRRGRTLLFLMDEILRGTNSYERQAAVRQVLAHLLRQQAIGAVATHDLMLAEIEELAAACRPVHFRETLEGDAQRPAMSFDYLLRPGIATTRNALKLLQLVGLELDEEDGP